MKPRSLRKGLLILGAVLAAIALVLGGVVWDLRRKASAVLDRHEREGLAAIEALKGRTWKAGVLFGDELPGNRWDDFAKALAALEAVPEGDRDQIPEIVKTSGFEPDLVKLDEVFTKHRPIVDRLRSCFRHGDVKPPYAYEETFAMLLPQVSQSVQAAHYLEGAAGRLHQRGLDPEAMDHALMAIAVGQTIARGSSLVGFLVMRVCEESGMNKVRSILGDHSLSAAELQALAGTLDRLWSAQPTLREALDQEFAMDRYGIVSTCRISKLQELAPGGNLPRLPRYAFSTDLMAASALNEFERYFSAARSIGGLPLPDRQSAAGPIGVAALKTRNPLVALLLPALGRIYRSEALMTMRWRLMQIAVALAWHEAEKGKFPERLQELVPRYLPELTDCPFSGTPFGYKDGKVWSIGGDGKDDGGRSMVDEDEDDSDGDVVWTVKRK